MSFFYDLNKRLATLASKQDATQISEDAKAVAPKSKLAESIEVAETGYSAKAGRAGKDLGKPGKNFSKIAKSAGEKYGSKAAGERVAGAVLNKLRGKTEEAVAPMTPKQKSFAKLAPPTDKITFADKIAGAKKEVDEMLGDVAAEAMKAAIGRGKKVVADEGNAFTGALAKTPKGGKFKVGNKEFTDNSDLEEGYAEMDAWLAQREKEKGTGKFDKKKISTGTVYTRKHDDDADDAEVSNEPKRRGRPKGKDKGPERTTAKAWKHKGERKVKEAAGKCCPHCGESLEAEQELDEKAVSKKQQKFMGMVHAAQKGEKPASKEVAKVAKEMPKKAAKDFAATKHKGLPEKVKAKKESKEEVEETTVAGSVATSAEAPKASKGMQFGKGVYEGFNNSVENMIAESITVESTMSECGDGNMSPAITITADGDEAAKLMMLLKLAGLEGQSPATCPQCGSAPCGCAEVVDENHPDWPTNTEVGGENDPTLQTYSGGLNKPKSTGQTTTPVIASQLRRQVSMEENVDLERSLFKTWKNYKG